MISTVLSHTYKSIDKKQQEWLDLEKAKGEDLHRQKYPWYGYCPNKDRNGTKSKPKVREVEYDVLPSGVRLPGFLDIVQVGIGYDKNARENGFLDRTASVQKAIDWWFSEGREEYSQKLDKNKRNQAKSTSHEPEEDFGISENNEQAGPSHDDSPPRLGYMKPAPSQDSEDVDDLFREVSEEEWANMYDHEDESVADAGTSNQPQVSVQQQSQPAQEQVNDVYQHPDYPYYQNWGDMNQVSVQQQSQPAQEQFDNVYQHPGYPSYQNWGDMNQGPVQQEVQEPMQAPADDVLQLQEYIYPDPTGFGQGTGPGMPGAGAE
ncbi:hypothetical protein F5B20DRAFT_590535 [Whalleya microplaca]|nr:hypothetical protein F5B20DRAFT_590535 [Whalleya microplaca]